jgi:hypothetical protein
MYSAVQLRLESIPLQLRILVPVRCEIFGDREQVWNGAWKGGINLFEEGEQGRRMGEVHSSS